MVLANESLQDALEKVQTSINRQLDRQYRQLVDSLHGFLDDLFNYPLERPWPMTLARFAAHWDARGLRLTSRTMTSLERLIQDRLGPATGDQFAEGSGSFLDLTRLHTDAVSPYASNHSDNRDVEKEPDGKISFYAKWQAARVQTMFGLSDEERMRLEFYYHDQSQRMREGRPLLPEPLFLYEAKQRHQSGPSMQPMTNEQVAESIRREQEERYRELPPEERAKLDREWEREARQKYIDEYGHLAAFFNPGLAGGFGDFVSVMGGFAGAGMPNRSSPLPPARKQSTNRRGPRGKSKPPPVSTQKPKKRKRKDDEGGKKKSKSKPEFPPPVDNQRHPTRADGTVSENLRLASVSEEAMALLLHSLPDYVVIFWGQKQGMQGADIITFNLRTKQVTLWDVKYRTSAVRLRPSRTFEKNSPARKKAIDRAVKAVNSSSLTNSDKTLAVFSLQSNKFQTITVGTGNAKNSTIGD